jgi:hypothetical protein
VRTNSAIIAVLSILAFSTGCAGHKTSSVQKSQNSNPVSFDDLQLGSIRMIVRNSCPPIPSPNRKSRQEALSLLRREGILTTRGRVVSARWDRQLRAWSITIHHPTGIRSRWLVNGFSPNFEGGTHLPAFSGA